MADRRTLRADITGPTSRTLGGCEHCGGFRQGGITGVPSYLDISLGSLSELSYTLLLARDLKILSDEEWMRLDIIHQKAGGLTWVLYKSLSAKSVPAPT